MAEGADERRGDLGGDGGQALGAGGVRGVDQPLQGLADLDGPVRVRETSRSSASPSRSALDRPRLLGDQPVPLRQQPQQILARQLLMPAHARRSAHL